MVRECSVGSLCVVLSISMRRSVGRWGWYSSCFTLASFTEEGRSYRIAIFDVPLLVNSNGKNYKLDPNKLRMKLFALPLLLSICDAGPDELGLHACVGGALNDLQKKAEFCTHACSAVVPLAWPTEPALGYSSVHNCMDTCLRWASPLNLQFFIAFSFHEIH